MSNLPGTEQDSLFPHLSELSVTEILEAINSEDQKVALAVQNELSSVAPLIDRVVEALKNGGRLFYIGAGTSGRLGIVDASECPPTYGVPHEMVIGIIAGGDMAIRRAVEFAEDDETQAINDLLQYDINDKDVLIGLSASGKTPYVHGGLVEAKNLGISTACICCNKNTPIGKVSDFPIEVNVGPEVITGSTRMKAGTAQKLILNMITTTAMVKLGKVEGSKMVNMQLSNNKLIDRGTRMVVELTGLNYEQSQALLLETGSVKNAVDLFRKKA